MDEEKKDKIIIAYNRGYRVSTEGIMTNPEGKVCGGYLHPKGYYASCILINRKNKLIHVHRLQAYIKYKDEMFKNGILVRHLNSISTDNSWDNIAIGTSQDNSDDISEETKLAMHTKRGLTQRKYDYEAIKLFHAENKSHKETRSKFNIKGYSSLYKILKK